MTTRFEADVDQAARDRLEGLDWRVAPRQLTAPDAPAAPTGCPASWARCRQVEDQRNSDG